MLCDFHTHTCLSDGDLTAVELIRRAEVAGYDAIGLTDHVGAGGLERIVRECLEDALLVAPHWRIKVLVGVELTHVPPETIAELAARARAAGAQYVAVHGETPVEPTCPGTNLAAVKCPDVDYLCHPGPLTHGQAELAAANDVFVELSARKGHCYANGRVAAVALAAGARLLLGSDCHAAEDLLSPERAEAVLRGAGLDRDQAAAVLAANAEAFLHHLAR